MIPITLIGQAVSQGQVTSRGFASLHKVAVPVAKTENSG